MSGTKAIRYNEGKTTLSLTPPEMTEILGRVFMAGVGKYGRDNWRAGDGMPWTETYDSAMRHMLAWLGGEDTDPESKLPHMAHAAWNCLVLVYYNQHKNIYGSHNDRFKGNQVVPQMQEGHPAGGVLPEQGEAPGLDMPRVYEENGQGETGSEEKPQVKIKARRDELDEILPLFGCAIPRDPATSLEELQADIVAWADQTFPDRTAEEAFKKLVFEEIPELVAGGLKDPLEFADIIILVLDLAHLAGIRDLSKAIRGKMAVNRTRTWERDPVTGIRRGVKP